MEGGVRYNYAAASHGAKVVATNKEAKGGNAVLDDDKDKYWRTPCSAEVKFLVIELSEVLTRVDAVVLGNYEFYSSQVKEFEVLGSRAYPTQRWTLLGRFNATNVRGPQAFDVGVEVDHLLRYVQLRLLSAHGAEFFCTLTLVRVLGIDELEALREEMEALTLTDDSTSASANVAPANVVAPPPPPLPPPTPPTPPNPPPLPPVAPSKVPLEDEQGTFLAAEEALSSPAVAVAVAVAVAPAALNGEHTGPDRDGAAGGGAKGAPLLLLSGQLLSSPAGVPATLSPPEVIQQHAAKAAAAAAAASAAESTGLVPSASLAPVSSSSREAEALARANLVHGLGDAVVVVVDGAVGGGKKAGEPGSPVASPSLQEGTMQHEATTASPASPGEGVALPAGGLPRVTGSGGGGDFILKTLMHKLRSLEVNQSLLDRYVDDLTKKYLATVADIDAALKILQERVNDSSQAAITLADCLRASDERSEANAAAARQEVRHQLAEMDRQLVTLRLELLQLGLHIFATWIVAILGLLVASIVCCLRGRRAAPPPPPPPPRPNLPPLIPITVPQGAIYRSSPPLFSWCRKSISWLALALLAYFFIAVLVLDEPSY